MTTVIGKLMSYKISLNIMKELSKGTAERETGDRGELSAKKRVNIRKGNMIISMKDNLCRVVERKLEILLMLNE